mgnify:CR=1 FL=1
MRRRGRVRGDASTGWDKSAAREFTEPGRETLSAEFERPPAETEAIREALGPGESTDREYLVSLVDDEGAVHAACEKTLYVRRDE